MVAKFMGYGDDSNVAASDTRAMNTQPTLILIHGSWHDGSAWAQVQAQLAAAGVRSHAPTLRGHEPAANSRLITHDDYVATVLELLAAETSPVVLVGHSFGGSVISRVAALQPERCCGLIYYSAFVPRDGERVADSLPEGMLAFLNQSADASPDRSITLPYDLFRQAFANTASALTAELHYQSLVPEPYGPIFETLALPNLDELGIPSAYIHCTQDHSLPAGTFHPGQSSRLKTATIIELDADHEALFTAPDRLATAALDATQAIGALHVTKPGPTSRHAFLST
jgi:pimeloyl-ACP methyl ester carboxylesterase